MDWIAAILIPCALAVVIVIAFFRYRSRITVSLKGPAGFGAERRSGLR